MKTILIAIPTDRHIQAETFKSLWDLHVPPGYRVDFQYFYGYSRSQILNLVCEWGKRYEAFLLVDRNTILDKTTLTDCISKGADLVSVDDTKSMFVSGNLLKKMQYPHFTPGETQIVERQKFIESARSVGASYAHIIGKTKTVSRAII